VRNSGHERTTDRENKAKNIRAGVAFAALWRLLYILRPPVSLRSSVYLLRVFIRDRSGSMPPHSAAAQRDFYAHNAMTANFSDQGMTGSAKPFRREIQAMRGPFSVALAGPKEGFSGPRSEVGGRRGGSEINFAGLFGNLEGKHREGLRRIKECGIDEPNRQTPILPFPPFSPLFRSPSPCNPARVHFPIPFSLLDFPQSGRADTWPDR